MENNKFWNLLTQAITLPFDIESVISVEENCGTVWITTEDGTYYLTCEKCEDEDSAH